MTNCLRLTGWRRFLNSFAVTQDGEEAGESADEPGCRCKTWNDYRLPPPGCNVPATHVFLIDRFAERQSPFRSEERWPG